MMPKGVDHTKHVLFLHYAAVVQKSLMPKGVDHESGAVHVVRSVEVQKSLMPKGVDHNILRPVKDYPKGACKNL